MNVREIFTAALEKTNEAERSAFLEEACAGDAKIRERVDGLLNAKEHVSDFLEGPPPGMSLTIQCDGENTFGQSLEDLSLNFLEPCEKPGCLGTIGHYEVVGLIGRGGCGLVLRAYDPKLNRVVAIKIMAPELATNPTAVKRFLREAQAAASVRHDHVVTIHAIDETASLPFIVMEYVEGQSLKELVDEQGEMEFVEILRIGQQIAMGLSEAHHQGLVHRDIKPANILLENGIRRVKITDFGLARAVDDISMTQTGMIAGTPQFMSPEQSMGHPIDARSDLFSLGSVLYTLCTGRPAFRADSAVATLRSVCDETPRPIRSVNPETPEWFESVVMRLMEKSPADRFQSASELSEHLRDCLAHIQGKGSSDPLPENLLLVTRQSTAKALIARMPDWGRKFNLPGHLVAAFVCCRNKAFFISLYAVFMLCVAGSVVAAFLDYQSIPVTGIFVGLMMSVVVARLSFRNSANTQMRIFSLVTFAFTSIVIFIASALPWNTVMEFLRTADWVYWSILAYASVMLPVGVYGLAKELGMPRDRSVLRFDLRAALIATAVVAFSCAGAQPCAPISGTCFYAGILFVGTLVSVAFISAYHLWYRNEKQRSKYVTGIVVTSASVLLIFWLISYDIEKSTERGQIMVLTTDVPVTITLVHKESGVTFDTVIDRNEDMFGYLHGEVELTLPDHPDLKIVPSILEIGRAETTRVQIIRVDDERLSGQ